MKRTITVRLSEELLELLDELVTVGIFRSRSEAVAAAVEELVEKVLLAVPRR
ncbi:MAG: ribbon-helix-helix protein, CopG family [Fervidicoccaceae archaeon]